MEVGGAEADVLRRVFSRYCKYGSLGWTEDKLTCQKFEKFVFDSGLPQHVQERAAAVFQNCIPKLDKKMGFGQFLNSIGMLAVAVYKPGPAAFNTAVAKLLKEHIFALGLSDPEACISTLSTSRTRVWSNPAIDQESMGFRRSEDEVSTSGSVSTLDRKKERKELIRDGMELSVSSELSSCLSHSETISTLSREVTATPSPSSIGSLAGKSLGANSQENKHDEAKSTTHDSIDLKLQLSTPESNLDKDDQQSTASTSLATMKTTNLPSLKSEEIEKNEDDFHAEFLDDGRVQIDQGTVAVLKRIYDSYSYHWCVGRGRQRRKRELRTNHSEYAGKNFRYGREDVFEKGSIGASCIQTETLLRRRTTFRWVSKMCFGGFRAFVEDFQLYNGAPRDIVEAFQAGLSMRRASSPRLGNENKLVNNALSEEDVYFYELDFFPFLSAVMCLAVKQHRGEAVPFPEIVGTLVESCLQKEVAIFSCCQNDTQHCSCSEPTKQIQIDRYLLHNACRQDPLAVQILERSLEPLRNIFVFYCDIESNKIERLLLPCQGGRCGAPKPLLTEEAFLQFLREFELCPSLVSPYQGRSLLRSYFTPPTTPTEKSLRFSSSSPIDYRVDFQAFIGLLTYCAVEGLSRYPYNTSASKTNEKISLVLEKMQVSGGMKKIFPQSIALVNQNQLAEDAEQVEEVAQDAIQNVPDDDETLTPLMAVKELELITKKLSKRLEKNYVRVELDERIETEEKIYRDEDLGDEHNNFETNGVNEEEEESEEEEVWKVDMAMSNLDHPLTRKPNRKNNNSKIGKSDRKGSATNPAIHGSRISSNYERALRRKLHKAATFSHPCPKKSVPSTRPSSPRSSASTDTFASGGSRPLRSLFARDSSFKHLSSARSPPVPPAKPRSNNIAHRSHVTPQVSQSRVFTSANPLGLVKDKTQVVDRLIALSQRIRSISLEQKITRALQPNH